MPEPEGELQSTNIDKDASAKWDALKETSTNENASEKASSPDLDRTGARALARAGFHASKLAKDIVDSSFEKSRKRGEKLHSTKPAERRNEAYLSRLSRALEKHPRLEKRLWDASSERLIIRAQDIPESYWQTQEQILRDEGHGNVRLGATERQEYTKELQSRQRESIKSWTDYFNHEDCPYPTWFKLYAWNGVSKMGVFDKTKGEFKKRDASTVAPYPRLNQAVLAKTYDVVSDFYALGQTRLSDTKLDENQLQALISSGNFSRLYSKLLLEQKSAPEVPERTEDVKGDWIEYLPGEEDKLASAAEGTPWCVASPSVGRDYLEYGSYGGDSYYSGHDSKAKFILFHLEDSDTNTLAENACASIRLDPDGNVAELSGLKDGQGIDDALIPIVEEKIKTLPGGEHFLEALADKKMLIALDRKMQAGEDLTKEDYEFLYEVHRPIRSLDTYGSDPRIEELQAEYDVGKAIEAGVDIDDLVSNLDSYHIISNLDTLLSHGANIDNLVSNLNPDIIAYNLGTLLDHGAKIDIDDLVSKLDPSEIVYDLGTLLSHGAKIDIDDLVSKLHYVDIVSNLGTLLSHGVDIDDLVSNLDSYHIISNLDTLLSHGANIDNLVSNLNPDIIAYNFGTLLDHGAKIDIDDLVSNLDSYHIASSLDALLSHGVDIDDLVSKLYYVDIANNLDALLSHGANIDDLVSKLRPSSIVNNLDTLLSHGVDIDDLVSKLTPYEIVENLDALLSHGAKINIYELVSKLPRRFVNQNLDTLTKARK